MATKKKFRTMYDTQGFNDNEPGGGVSITDKSQYEPIVETLRRFGQGELVGGSASPVFEVEGDPQDAEENEKIFADAQAKEENLRRLSNKGEEAIAREHVAIKRKINKAKSAREKSRSAPVVNPPSPGVPPKPDGSK